jgi:hypothetical protein
MRATRRALELEAFETDPWAADAILKVELMPAEIWIPCHGKGGLERAIHGANFCPAAVVTSDVFDWSTLFANVRQPKHVGDFLTDDWRPFRGSEFGVFINPPFSKACEFVDRAIELGARKVLCFQRYSWREGLGRRDWWEKRPPARVWLCGSRATCWRFDIPEQCLGERCGKGKSTGSTRCRKCMAGTTVAHAWFVWERSHRGIEALGTIWREA